MDYSADPDFGSGTVITRTKEFPDLHHLCMSDRVVSTLSGAQQVALTLHDGLQQNAGHRKHRLPMHDEASQLGPYDQCKSGLSIACSNPFLAVTMPKVSDRLQTAD